MITFQNPLTLILITLSSIILASCDSGGDADPITNSAPTFSSSSASISVQENTTGVIYTAQATDAEGNSINYALSGGVDQAKFSIDASSGELRFVSAPDYEVPDDDGRDRTYEVQISASDSLASSSMSLSVSITNVVEDGESNNRAPTASISVSPDPDSTTLTTATEITLNGSDSSDPDGDTLDYTWSQASNQSIDLSSTSTATTTFTAANPGTYTFTLTVDDGSLTDSAEVTLEIIQADSTNRAPTAIISVSPDPDSTTLTTTTEITLDGSNSSDLDEDTLTYEWSQPSSQSIDLSATNATTTSFTAAAPGTYTLTLTVDDGSLTDSAEVTLEIIQADSTNRAPTASIIVSPDPDSTTLTTATEITLDGSNSSDPDEDTLTYEWSQPSSQSIDLSATNTSSTKFTATNPGTYTFTLSVSDGELSDSSTVIMAIAQANRAPTASISVSPDPDSTTLTTATEITLNGSASSDPDGDALDYTWSQPDSQSIDLSATNTASTKFTATDPGTYTFTLSVNDGELSDSSTVIMAIAQANRAPTASISVSPDPDSTTLTTATEITLNGSASSDPDGDALDYTWSQPSAQSIDLSATNTAITTFTATDPGTYTFTLSISDGELGDNSEAIVTIHPITLPTDFTAIAGDAQVTLTWTPYSDSTIYNIYRSTNPDCDLDSYTTACSTSEGALFSAKDSGFIDSGLSNDTTYYYWIEAIYDGATQRATSPISATPQQIITETTTISLNDSGIDWGGGDDPRKNYDDCSSDITAPQDCHQGRDADSSTNDDSDGHAGFSFTKLDSNGGALAASANEWSCVQDNVTGLIWEVKTNDDELHDKDDSYTWYDTDSATNGGAVGSADSQGNTCHGYNASDTSTYCNIEAFAARVNSAGLCGAHNWRVPSRLELRSIVDYSRINPSIDVDYFPNTISNSSYLSASAYAKDSEGSWQVQFFYGYDTFLDRKNSYPVRLVRSSK